MAYRELKKKNRLKYGQDIYYYKSVEVVSVLFFFFIIFHSLYSRRVARVFFLYSFRKFIFIHCLE